MFLWNKITNCECEVKIDKIVYLTEQSVDVLPPVLSSAERGGIMSTYEELMIILAVASLIVAILNLTHKK